MDHTRRRVAAALYALATTLAASPALAQASYPAKPVTLVVPYPAGGPTDIVARVVAQRLQAQTGQAFVVDNKAGAGGNLGAEAVARAAPDGYTLLVATTAHAINATLFRKLNYQFRDLAPVSQLTSGPLVLAVTPALPVRSVPELIALARSKPGTLNYASSGNGQSTHLAGELFNTMAGTDIRHVPYKGSAPALSDTMAGQVHVIFDTMLSAMPHVKADKLRALAVTSAQPSPAAPELPTVAASVPGYEVIAWNGLLAPAGTPRAVVERLNAELRTALELPEVRERFAAQGFAASWSAPEAFAGFIAAEIAKWAKVVQQSGATVE